MGFLKKMLKAVGVEVLTKEEYEKQERERNRFPFNVQDVHDVLEKAHEYKLAPVKKTTPEWVRSEEETYELSVEGFSIKTRHYSPGYAGAESTLQLTIELRDGESKLVICEQTVEKFMVTVGFDKVIWKHEGSYIDKLGEILKPLKEKCSDEFMKRWRADREREQLEKDKELELQKKFDSKYRV